MYVEITSSAGEKFAFDAATMIIHEKGDPQGKPMVSQALCKDRIISRMVSERVTAVSDSDDVVFKPFSSVRIRDGNPVVDPNVEGGGSVRKRVKTALA